MKKLTYLFLAILIVACSSDDSDLGNNQNCLSLLTDKTWFPVEGTSEIFTYVRFDSNGDFYEEGELDGTWALESNCNTIKIYSYSSIKVFYASKTSQKISSS